MSLQLHQSLNLLLLLVLGLFTANITLSWGDILAIVFFTLFFEHLLLYFSKRRYFYFSYSSFSTAIGVLFLLYCTSIWIYFVVISFALLQKHFLTLREKHLFNPSNFALIFALIFFYDEAHIISGQLGDNLFFSMIAFVLAMSMLVRVKRLVISIVFLLSYLLFQYFFVASYEPTVIFKEIYHRLYMVTFMLFIYFMLTDPRVTPSSIKGQIVFGLAIALCSTLLDRFYGFRVQHLFMSVFFFSFWVNILPLKGLSTQELKLTMLILFLIIGCLAYIEYQVPYFFEMNG